ncbi:helix-turn-helix transcriptional regulator [Actinomadura sp. DC4]|uniref:helix-turn-helix domain-containing protein n=1 Tax=Actinomadura sp. DC4 TaxID=3055069 RepID=UPI0025B1AB08|nr:helix-turn-helix transcriptional regulator [Actinomadura sp. DC4]MDN3358225.1 helix-turn-helix transcriptional regulator [Actinomadura sp. DC4]
MAAQGTSFGPELRRRRTTAGLSLTQLAARTHYTKGYLSKIENGTKPPGPDLARRCDAALGSGGELAALVERPAPDEPPVAEVSGSETWTIKLAPDGGARFLPAADETEGATPLWLDAGGGLSAAVGEHRIASTLAVFRAQFDQARALGRWASPALVLPTVIAQTHTLRGLAAAAREPERGRLLFLAARYAEFAGWMAQEAGDERAAAWWTRQSVRIAAPTGSAVLAVYSLVREAEISLYRDDAVRVIELAHEAQSTTRVPARVLGLAAQREAQGHALYGDYDNCRRTLDRAAELLATPPATGPDEPIIGSTTVSDLNAMVTGWCLHDLGRPAEAAELLDREVPHIAETALRSRVRFGVRRALAHASAGEVDHACTLSGDLLDLIDLVDSATVRVDLRRLTHTLARWHTHGQVREVYPRLTAALRTNTF